jgi:tRNA A37 threonylcarbamoyladenosine modification protein TsaB
MLGTSGTLKVLIPEMAVSPMTMIQAVAQLGQLAQVDHVAHVNMVQQMVQPLDRSPKILFVGNGARLYEGMIRERLGERAEFLPRYYHYPRASVVAGLGLNRLALQQFDRVETLAPTYLRPSDAEINWVQKHGS